MAAPLQLTDVAHGEQKGWRRSQHLVDSLPYVDGLTPQEKAAVDKLIEEEMRSSSKKPTDYLNELPPLPETRFKGDELLEKEMARVAAGEPMQAMDTARYNLDPPPPTKRNDHNAWRTALDNAHAQLEHQYNRLLNLELLLKFGPDSWRLHNEALSAFVTRLQEQLAAVKQQVDTLNRERQLQHSFVTNSISSTNCNAACPQVDTLNRERKLQQHAAGSELGKLEAEYLGLVHKNMDIEAACRGLEAEIAAMREALPRDGSGSAADGQQAAAEQQQQGGQPNGVGEPAEGMQD
ncbi:pre-mRNA-splicing factor SPF27-like protein isoform A [Chlorella sorokiniana]|uniref:Pre-mRNA-splicing factor SPF27-like protein isoform A n=1 Tax=Chlorella sorokiniana TaxID=3076 RepID=A0A2P6TK15_CHLSO|nr:pre-mRNA-splicing factor SPF27-like protein isoform A [Chlorella sorokiniana]|eukprot:PRW44378.1 pre-mRNA-splicing factor SPF27-like protein isoform A [Chlorella sorokiniana]